MFYVKERMLQPRMIDISVRQKLDYQNVMSVTIRIERHESLNRRNILR